MNQLIRSLTTAGDRNYISGIISGSRPFMSEVEQIELLDKAIRALDKGEYRDWQKQATKEYLKEEKEMIEEWLTVNQ